MRRIVAPIAAVLVLAALAAPVRGDDLTVPIVIAPSTINLKAAGTWVTVHAEIAYSTVDTASVMLDGIPVKTTFADNRGELVAKFLVGDVRDIVKPDTTPELTLSGTTDDGGGTFSGADMVRVIDVSGKP